ncbi:MAG: DNA polymerase III subunit epsilon [Candidatus Competibacteraceae bacterium]|nr:DNA polymerase III subunit epsilon [Candidatus Competibacteraceae bacterium]
MHDNFRFIVAMATFLMLVLGLIGVAGYGIFHVVEADEQRRLLEILAPHAELIAEIGLLALAILGIAFAAAYQIYVKGSLKVVEGIRIILSANAGHRLAATGPTELRLLAQAVNALARHGERLAEDLEGKVAQAKSSVEEEKNRLAALVSELSQGVLVCNIDGRILLYNERARHALLDPTQLTNRGATSLIGLGRSIFTIVDRNLLAHALENMQGRLEKKEGDTSAQFVFTTPSGQFIRVRMALVLAASKPSASKTVASESGDSTAPASSVASPTEIRGFVMTLENITQTFDVDTTRDMLLQSLTEGSRAALASIRAAVETLAAYPDCETVTRDRFIQVIHEEASTLSVKLDKTTLDYADSLKTRWPLEEMLGVDIVAAARRRIENRLGLSARAEVLDDSLWIKVDSYTLVQALSYLAGRLKDEYEVQDICFNLTRHARIAELDLAWAGSPLSSRTLSDWEMDTMRAGGEESPLTLRDVIDRLGAEIVYMVDQLRQRSFIRFLLPMVKPTRVGFGAPVHFGESRPEFYDFDLFHQAGQTPELDQLPLTELAYTVFDTETTGLDPSAGDEIISIGAVRIVNNRLLRYETYEQLIDPGRPIVSMSQTIHGLSNEMLRGQPMIDQVLSQFHEYCHDTVLVGHNAAFDMRFLQMKETQTGIRFTQPVLDTLLLSGVLHPNQESHALEAIAGRLGVTVVARHTALGDALVTGEVFLRMIPLLAAHGIRTLRDAREATEKSLYAKVDY